MFFNENGILNIDEMLADNASFNNIMEDGSVTDEELSVQGQKVLEMFRKMEGRYSEDQLTEIKELLVESSILFALYNIYSIQDIYNK